MSSVGTTPQAERKKALLTSCPKKPWPSKQASGRTYLSPAERGERYIAVLNLKRLAEALGVEVRALVKGVG